MADSALGRFSSFGLLITRLVIGGSFIVYGVSKFQLGKETLTAIGSVASNIGVPSQYHYAFGLMAASAETLGGILLVLGALFRPACLVLTFVMCMAMTHHIKHGDPFQNGYDHALQMLSIILGLLFIGPGRIALRRGRKAKPAPAESAKSKE